MSDLNSRERRKLESLLQMGSGWVLNFNDRTYNEFFDEFVGVNIDDPKYQSHGPSKAKRMRSFWDQAPNGVVAQVLKELIEHARSYNILTADTALLADCQAIITRLSLDQPVADLQAISVDDADRNFGLVAKAAKESIERNQPQEGLDRLHTFVVKFFRKLCEERGLPVDRGTPLNGLVGAYVKNVRENGQFSSTMAEHILKSSIGNLEQFNHVRNKHTLAHDNEVLGYDEALLIFNNVASTVRFVRAMEERLESTTQKAALTPFADGAEPPL